MKYYVSNSALALSLLLLTSSTQIKPVNSITPYITAAVTGLGTAAALCIKYDGSLHSEVGYTINTAYYATVAAAVAGLAACITYQYTPKAKLAWAQYKKQAIENSHFCSTTFVNAQEMETYINRNFAATNWPDVTVYRILQTHYNDALAAHQYVEEAMDEMMEDKQSKHVIALKDDLAKHIETIGSSLRFIRDLPYFFEHLYACEMVEAQVQIANAQRMQTHFVVTYHY